MRCCSCKILASYVVCSNLCTITVADISKTVDHFSANIWLESSNHSSSDIGNIFNNITIQIFLVTNVFSHLVKTSFQQYCIVTKKLVIAFFVSSISLERYLEAFLVLTYSIALSTSEVTLPKQSKGSSMPMFLVSLVGVL